MQIRYSPHPTDYPKLSTDELRAAFLIESLFAPGKLELVYTDADRAIVGSAVPTGSPLKLTADAELRSRFFCERRELGILNIGGNGAVEVDEKNYELGKLDCLYVGRGSENISFTSKDAANPAAFYLLSYPAHTAYPTTLAHTKDATPVELGTVADANRRTIYKYIHTGGIKSCQLVMGFTKLQEGAVWNTMPPHTHTRRSEVYVYFDLGARRVMHFMGEPKQTRHLVVSERQVVISPSWSIHCGCGTGAYTFCWGMGGENQTFEDMDPAPIDQLR
ncbi:MAG TPA: 5-dehydro-4-deoxy-D-glucuronate isomerase [Verrucomicrobiae bacterium]|nr:5-dehydro-4-deoxy-D-glucuronate isomerase [Verrucomicrobiae bacterium]